MRSKIQLLGGDKKQSGQEIAALRSEVQGLRSENAGVRSENSSLRYWLLYAKRHISTNVVVWGAPAYTGNLNENQFCVADEFVQHLKQKRFVFHATVTLSARFECFGNLRVFFFGGLEGCSRFSSRLKKRINVFVTSSDRWVNRRTVAVWLFPLVT